MPKKKIIFLNSHFRLVSMGLVNGFVFQKLLQFSVQFWSSVSTLFFALFGLLNRAVFRIKGTEYWSETNKTDCFEDDFSSVVKEDEAIEPEFEFKEIIEGNNDVKLEEEEVEEGEKEDAPNFFFKFQFQTYRENYEAVESEYVPSTSTNKYEFLSEKGFTHYLEEPKVVTVKELYADSNGSLFNDENTVNIVSEKEFIEQVEENSADTTSKEEANEKLETEALIDKSNSDKGKAIQEVENDIWRDQDILKDEEYVQFLSEEDLIASDSDSVTSSHGFTSRFAASTSDGFLSDKEIDYPLKGIDVEKVESSKEELDTEDINLQNFTGYEPDDLEEDSSDIMEEFQNIDESVLGNTKSVEEFQENSSCNQVMSEGPEEENSSAWDSEDSNRLEILWEHQDLIEQLKMELKKVKATGLPTILEEDESPKIMKDLKPWKIDEKFQHEDTMGELHKFYRSYRERMRKFDILNYQKMYAIGFLQSKDPLQSISSHKASGPALTSLLSQKFKRKKSDSDPMMNFLKELHSDLEMVYVGQMCLSWEILHWQYEKAIELWESDTHLVRRYNEVAGDFQQFQVLMQRFIENEPFEGPRVQNYIKNRCILRNLLQVPVIREDSVKDKKARRKGNDDDAIASDMLVEIMEESIRIFWRFVRADKDSHTVTQKSRKGTQIEPQDPSELQLLTEVRTSLQKKEKKLKETLRSGSCILRKFKKEKEESSENVLFFFSQVDMRLVSRVLNMSKTSMDQLLWCHNKLNKINFVCRKIQVEPSFLLFPSS